MALSTGITPDENLCLVFAGTRSATNKFRLLTARISNNAIVSHLTMKNLGTPDSECFDDLVRKLDLSQSQYMLYQMDNHDWISILYIPDGAKVSDRMLYSSSISALKKEFGSTRITVNHHASSNAELSWSHIYSMHIDKSDHDNLLTESEKMRNKCHEDEEIARQQMQQNRGKTAALNSSSLSFGFTDKARNSLEDFQSGKVNLVILVLNTEAERFEVYLSERCRNESVAGLVPSDRSSFTIFRFEFGNSGQSQIFFAMSIENFRYSFWSRFIF